MDLDISGLRVEPSLAFDGQALNSSRTLEQSYAPIALSVSAGGVRSLRSELGVRVERLFAVAGHAFVSTARLGWSHEYGDTSTDVSSVFSTLGGPAFATSTAAFGRNGLVGGAGLTTTLAPRLSVFAGYDADVRSRLTVQAVTGGLRSTW